MRRRTMISAVLVSLLLWPVTGCITVNLVPPPAPLKEEQVGGKGKDKVLMIDLSGVISSRDQGSVLSETPNMVAQIKEALTRAAEDEKIKAVELRINSPGGTVTASDILYHEVKAFKEKRKIPIVASIMDVGASGGYYVAAAADTILAHPASVTGSVGVIMLTVNANGLLEKIGLQTTAVTSGPRKDMGSPFRPMTPEERAIFQGVIDSFYERFLAVVHEGRPALSPEQVRKLADGRIFSGEQAMANGLVDGIGYLDDAIELAKRTAGVSEARVVVYRRPGEYRNNIYSRWLLEGGFGLPSLDMLGLLRGGTPQFMYLWMP
jgi:protease-4